MPDVLVRVKLLPLTPTEYVFEHWKELSDLHAADTEEVSNAIAPDADPYEDEAVVLIEDAMQEPDEPVLGH